MKTLLQVILVSTTIMLTAPVAVAHQHEDAQAHTGKMDMPKMQNHMNEMQSILDKARVETDLQKRQQLLHQHAKKMESMMNMMSEGKSKHKMHKMGKHGMNKSNMTDKQRITMMEGRIAMMEKMMEQMMGNAAESTKKSHKHKKN